MSARIAPRNRSHLCSVPPGNRLAPKQKTRRSSNNSSNRRNAVPGAAADGAVAAVAVAVVVNVQRSRRRNSRRFRLLHLTGQTVQTVPIALKARVVAAAAGADVSAGGAEVRVAVRDRSRRPSDDGSGGLQPADDGLKPVATLGSSGADRRLTRMCRAEHSAKPSQRMQYPSLFSGL